MFQIYLNCEQDICNFVLGMKLPAAVKDQIGECHQVKTDVDQETTQHLAETKHVADEMSATNHQTNYLYKRNASYVIDVTCAKYKH